MTREIIFRGKCIGSNNWIYGSLIILNLATESESEPYIDSYQIHDGISDAQDVYIDSVGQYIGLTDNDGKDIFENDILEKTGTCLFDWLVEFKDGCFVIVNIGIDGYLGDRCTVDSTTFSDRKIIGNKTDNPELLKNRL